MSVRGTCSHCGELHTVENGLIVGHDWPKPCRQICHGAGIPPGTSVDRRCEHCGTPVDASDYQDDGYRHHDGRCIEYLKVALRQVRDQRDAYLANLTSVQQRCTELFEENRALRLAALKELVEETEKLGLYDTE